MLVVFLQVPLLSTSCRHQLVSAVIDDTPTALAFTADGALWIGNSLSLSIWMPDGTVCLHSAIMWALLHLIHGRYMPAGQPQALWCCAAR